MEPDALRRILRESRTVAVLGANPKAYKPAHYVPRYLWGTGYALYPVNPTCAGRTLFGQTVVPSLRDLDVPIDIVLVFRRSERIPEHVEAILAMAPPPKTVWFQLGIRNEEAAKRLEEAGLEVVQDRCMLIDHQRLL